MITKNLITILVWMQHILKTLLVLVCIVELGLSCLN